MTWYARARARGLIASGEPDTRFGRRYFVRRRVVGAEGRGKSGVSRRFERRDWIVSAVGRTNAIHLRCRILSRLAFSRRLLSAAVLAGRGTR